MKIVLLMVICCFCLQAHSQSTTKYYDSNWNETPKERAYYHKDFITNRDSFTTISYFEESGSLHSVTNFADSGFTRRTGTQKVYYKSGRLLDSIIYDNKGGYEIFDEYSENGYRTVHAFYDEKERTMMGERYDSLGNKIPGFFTFQKQAQFPGGAQGWANYLQTHLKADVPSRRRAPVGNYTVMVSFLVLKDGKISEVKAENDPGYGTAEEAVRVIKNGPDWIPAVQNNKTVIYRQKQGITFQVTR